MKFVLSFAVLVLALVYSAEAAGHDKKWGERGKDDIKVYHNIHSKKGAFLQVQRGTLDYIANDTITYIEVVDQYASGKGGYATLAKGGPGRPKVSIDFESQRGQGYNFIVDIWIKGAPATEPPTEEPTDPPSEEVTEPATEE